LQAAEIEEAWRQVGPRLQNTRASADLAVRRHRRRMRLNEQARDWFGAEFHARRLVELQPGDATAQADVIRIRAIRPPAREPGTPPELVDLSAFYNASLPESWHGGTDNHLAELPRGVQWLAGTRFDVRGLIQVYVNDSRFPQAVTGIRISQKLERLQFLHASQGGPPPDGTRVGYYFVHFANGRSEEIPIIFGRDMCDWGDNSGTLAEASHAVIAWKGTNPAAVREGHRGRRLFKSTWENPAPDVEVTTIDFVAVYESANPFLVALTAESGPSSDRNAHLTPAGPRP
jgi:hypothetical protein